MRQWAEIVQQLGAEIAGPLSQALDRIHDLTATGQIDRRGLRQLRQCVEDARAAGMLGQQLARLASGRLRLGRERLHLTQMVRSVLSQRSRETQARGLQVRQMLEPVQVWADGALLFALLNAVLDWALADTCTAIELRLSVSPWPPSARLSCSFAHRSAEPVGGGEDTEPTQPGLDSLAWRLVEQTALALGVHPQRRRDASLTQLELEFTQLAGADPDAADAPAPPGDAEAQQANQASQADQSRPLTGYHLLIVSPDRLLRAEVQDAVRHLGLMVELLSTPEEVLQFCLDGPPHALIFDAALRGSELEGLIADLLRDLPEFCAIELSPGDAPTRLSTATPDGQARIARAHLPDALPGLLTFELSRHR